MSFKLSIIGTMLVLALVFAVFKASATPDQSVDMQDWRLRDEERNIFDDYEVAPRDDGLEDFIQIRNGSSETATVQFDQASYSVNEDDVTATITVTLDIISTLPVSVTYQTSDDTATAGSDYTAVSDTLTFAPGETSRAFSVPIIDDSLDEPDESLNLTLSDPVSATLGEQSSAVLTIIDNDVPSPTPTNTSTPTPSMTPTPTNSPTPTETATFTPTVVPSQIVPKSVFLPITIRSIPPTPTPTATFTYTPTVQPTVTSTPTPVPTTIPTNTPTATPAYTVPIGDTVKFKGVWNEVPMTGVAAFSERRTSLQPDYGDPVYPQGIFVVVILDVTNHGLESDEVGMYSSFRLKDSAGRKFDLADIYAQIAVEDEYDLGGVYDPIQPGFTVKLVFVFDVLLESQGLRLDSLSPW